MDQPARCRHTVPYGTAFSGWRFLRHFVPGYNRTSPRDISPQAQAGPLREGNRSCQILLIFAPFGTDNGFDRQGPRIKFSVHGLQPGLTF
jgi:hypothetical protein